MRDEMDARVWNAHHDQFSKSIDAGLARLAGSVPAVPRQLVAGAAAFGLALLTVGVSIA
jgi:hypothetical protein